MLQRPYFHQEKISDKKIETIIAESFAVDRQRKARSKARDGAIKIAAIKNKESIQKKDDALDIITQIGKAIDSYRHETQRMMNSEKSSEAISVLKKIKGLIK